MDVMDAANYFIDASKSEGEEGEGVSNLKLQRLLYLAQMVALREQGEPLFDGDFEAWDCGPVVPCVYRAFKDNKGKSIRVAYGDFDHARLSARDRDLLTRVYRYFRQYSAYGLANLTHKSGHPWDQCCKHHQNVMDMKMLKEWAQEHDPGVPRSRRRKPKNVKYRIGTDGHTHLPGEPLEDE